MDEYKKLFYFSEHKINPILEKMGLPTQIKQIMNFEIIEFVLFCCVLTLFGIMAGASATLHFTGIHWLFIIAFGLGGTILSLPVKKNNIIARTKRKIFSFLPYYSHLEDSYYYRKEIIVNELQSEENQFAILEHIELIIQLYKQSPIQEQTQLKHLIHYKKMFVKSIVSQNYDKLFNNFIMLLPLMEQFKQSTCYKQLCFNEQYHIYKKNSLDHALSQEAYMEVEIGDTKNIKNNFHTQVKDYL